MLHIPGFLKVVLHEIPQMERNGKVKAVALNSAFLEILNGAWSRWLADGSDYISPTTIIPSGTSPKLSSFYVPLPAINQLPSGPVVPEIVDVIMFANYLSFFSSFPNKEVTEAAMHGTIKKEAEWSSYHKLTLSTNKREAAISTNTPKKARW